MVKDKLNWASGRMIYYEDAKQSISYDIQVDACYPNVKKPLAFACVTYCNPDTPGHSNENKLQLKLGELMLLKAKYPKIRAILVIGGTKEAWLAYVLQAFNYFFDKVICAWDNDFDLQINTIAKDPTVIACKHSDIWHTLSTKWQTTALLYSTPINSFLRENAWNYMKKLVVKEMSLLKSVIKSFKIVCKLHMIAALQHVPEVALNGKII